MCKNRMEHTFIEGSGSSLKSSNSDIFNFEKNAKSADFWKVLNLPCFLGRSAVCLIKKIEIKINNVDEEYTRKGKQS